MSVSITSGAALKRLRDAELTQLVQLLTQCRGPHGEVVMVKAVTAADGQVVVSSVAKRLADGISRLGQHSELLVRLCSGLVTRQQDGGLLCWLLTARLVLKADQLDGVPHSLLQEVYNDCRTWIIHRLQAPFDQVPEVVREISLVDVHTLLAVSKTVLGSKGTCRLSHEDLHHLAVTVTQAFIKVCPTEAVPGRKPVKVVSAVGLSPSKTLLFSGVLLPKRNVYWAKEWPPAEVSSIRVALITVTVDGKSLVSEVELQDDTDLARAAEVENQRELCQRLISELHVHVLVCQRVLHPSIIAHLTTHGITCIDRLSLANLSAVAAVTGAKPVSSYVSIMAEDIGTLAALPHPIQVQEAQYIQLFMRDKESPSPQTIVLGAVDQTAMDELSELIPATLAALESLAECSAGAAGGGHTERYLASCLESWSREQYKKQSDFANRLRIVRAFAAALNKSGELPGFSAEHDKCLCVRGSLHRWPLCPSSLDSPDALIDPLGPKAAALVTAVTAALTILRITVKVG